MKPCDMQDCGQPATHQAEIVIYGRSEKLHTPATGRPGLYVCTAHATEDNARALLPDDGKKQIADGFLRAGYAAPDWSRSFVRWIAVAERGNTT